MGSDAPAARARAGGRWVVAAVVVGLAIRLAVASFPKFTTGDELWYASIARSLVLGQPTFVDATAFGRPPGTAWWLAGIWSLFGADNVVAARVANAVLSATTPWLAARCARALFPGMRSRLPAVVAWVQALNPVDIRAVQWLMAENLLTPLTLVAVLAGARLARRPTTGRAVALGVVVGALQMLRMDAFVTWAGVAAAVAVGRVARRGLPSLPRVAACGTVVVAVGAALCTPWSVFASVRTGRTVVICDAKSYPPFAERAGWLRWLSNSYLPRTDWLRIFWWGPRDVDRSWIPESAWGSPEEKAAMLRLMDRTVEARSLLPDADAEMDRIGRERRDASRFRFYVALPALRVLNVWFDPVDDDLPRHMAPTRRSLPSRLMDAALRAARPVAGLGFLLAAWLAVRLRARAVVGALPVLTRTFGLYFGFPLATGYAVHEARYIETVQPLALLLLAAAVLHVARNRRGRAARDPG